MNNTANAGRIVRSRNGRKILPAFLLTIFVAALADAAIPQEKIVYSQIRYRADHRTPAEPSAAVFSGLVSATAPSEQGIFAPCGSVLTWHK